MGKTTQAEVDFLVSYLKDKRALEIASGTGRMSRQLLEKECDLYGLEKSKWFWEKLKANIPTQHWNRFILWDAMNVPYPVAAQTFDCVIVPYKNLAEELFFNPKECIAIAATNINAQQHALQQGLVGYQMNKTTTGWSIVFGKPGQSN